MTVDGIHPGRNVAILDAVLAYARARGIPDPLTYNLTELIADLIADAHVLLELANP